jgi:hypothetical protein
MLGALLGCWLLLMLGLVVWPDNSCLNFLTDFIGDRLQTSGYTFRLYTNNVTPTTSTVIGDFTEATFTGYSSVAGSTVTWSTPALSGHIAQTNGTNIIFNNTSGAGVTVYGVYVTNAAGTKLYFAERDPAAPVTIPAGGSYTYTPNQQFKSIN